MRACAGRGAVDAGDGLQQFGLFHAPVQVQHLLDGRVEAGEQHRLDDEERGRFGRVLEVADRLLLVVQVGPGLPRLGVVLRWRDDRDKVRAGLGTWSMTSGGSFFGFLADEFVAGFEEGGAVADGGGSAVRGDLGLETVGQDGLDVVPEHVLRLGGDQFLGLHHVALGRVPLLDLLHLRWRVVGEHVLEDLVHVPPVAHRALDGAPGVVDRHDRLVPFGVGEPVDVDVGAEDPGGALLLPHEDGGAGEADPRGVRQRGQQVHVQGG